MTSTAGCLFFSGRKDDEAVYLLYLDEAGNPCNPEDRYFVLAGVAVFERQTFFLKERIDAIQEKYFPNREPIEFHAQHIRTGKGFWKGVDQDVREEILTVALPTAIHGVAGPAGAFLFAAIIEKNSELYGDLALERAIGEILSRFDIVLMDRYHSGGDAQRGLLVFDESSYQRRAKVWIDQFRRKGTRLGVPRNIADIPFFADSSDTRLLQFADFVAYAVWRLYEKRDDRLIRGMIGRFAGRDEKLHRLVHVGRPRDCECPTCSSRQAPGSYGPWIAELPVATE